MMTIATVEVFRTTVDTKRAASKIIQSLLSHFPNTKITFDLNDYDHVLRIAGEGIQCDKIMEIVKNAGFVCEVLE